MSRQHLRKFMADHHLKLWACGAGIVLTIALAAATPPLTSNSITRSRPRAVSAVPASPPNHLGLGLPLAAAHSQTASPSQAGTAGTSAARVTTVSSAAQLPPSAPAAGSAIVCPLAEDRDNSDFHGCSGRCQADSGACGCDGRGAEAMCPLSD
jgi:hypothetical protein